jgi:predicted amidohydrolase YtcJ
MKLFFNARIHTLDRNRPVVSAILLDGGRIIACGEKTDLLATGHKIEQELDLRGRVVLPGLTDAHLHLQHFALGLQKVDCETSSLQEAMDRVQERAQTTPPGEWVLGHGWNQNTWKLDTSEGFPSAADLDAFAPDKPVYLTAKSLHASWANTAALKLANITPGTPDPKDGRIVRDAAGRPTGILLESAMDLVSDCLPEFGADQVARAIEAAQPILWKMGLTGVHDFDRRLSFMALQQLQAQGRLKLRVNKNLPVEVVDQAAEIGLRTGFGNDMLWIGSMKAFMDGALGPHTAAMFQPYAGEADNRGMLNMDAEELFEYGRRAADAGLSMTVHAIGDRANHEVLNAYEHLRGYERENCLPALRHRIEHVQVLHPDDVSRLAQLGVIASMQPIHAISDMPVADRFWGERSALAYAWRSQLQHGAHLAFGSDAPVESPNPFLGLHAAVTRRQRDGAPGPEGWYPEQRLSLVEAIEAYTVGPAYAANSENRLGRLAPGYHADLILLEQDPFAAEPEALIEMHPAATMVAGEWVWQDGTL